MTTFEPCTFAELDSLRAAIARSQIILQQLALEARLADWEATRKAADVDDVVLAWLASHARPAQRRLDA
jgi:hypothetical protein